MTLNVEVGQTYQTRAGDLIQIVEKWPTAQLPFLGRRADGSMSFWAADGHCDFEPDPEDLIQQIQE